MCCDGAVKEWKWKKCNAKYEAEKKWEKPGTLGTCFFLVLVYYVRLVSRCQTFRLTAEGLESMVAFIVQGPPMRPFD